MLPPFVDKTKFVNDLGKELCDNLERIHTDVESAVDDESCTPDLMISFWIEQVFRFHTSKHYL